MFQGAIVTPNALIVTLNNKVYSVQSDHPNATRLKEAFKNKDVDDFLTAFDVKKAVQSYVEDGSVVDSGVTIDGDRVLYQGEEVHNSVVDAIQRMMTEGFDIKPMVKFLEKMMKNPSYNSIKEMWQFIEQCGLAITEDGCFLAYKTVNADYTDKYSGRIDNTPGTTPKRMERSQVDDNPNNHCSKGYHVGALAYAGPGGWYNGPNDHVLICKVDPADVVSVPNDFSCQKMRCCYYEPVGEFEGALKRSVYSGEVGGDYSSYVTEVYRFRPEKADAYDLLEDNFYIGLYTKNNGETSTRYFIVEEVDTLRGLYTVSLLEPEENAGQYRSFLRSRLSEVRTWDGKTDPMSLDDPYNMPSFYDEEDEEEEVCDYCGDYVDNCGGYCEDEEDDYEDDNDDNECDCAQCREARDEDEDDYFMNRKVNIYW